LIPDRKDWDITILGSDINGEFLRQAEEACYKEWSFRTTPLLIKQLYFKKDTSGKYMLIPSIQKMVKFMYFNLVEDSYPADLDLIVCHNVLIYFTPEQTHKVIRQLVSALSEDGWFSVSPVEMPFVNDPRLTRKQIGETAAFKREISSLKATPPTQVIKKPLPKAKLKVEVAQKKQPAYSETEKLFQKGDYLAVITHLENEALEKRPLKEICLLTHAYANKGDLENALKSSEIALKIEKLDPSLYYFHATILQELSRSHEAIQALKHALYLNPDFVVAHFTLGNLLLQQTQIEEAGRHFRNALTLLKNYSQEDILEESEGVTAGRLTEIISNITAARN
jgi:chemotaxis protein methyltransferase CheR